jgi:flagellar basal-body rod protein FlgG
MNSQQMSIDVIANNLANVNTTGFKKSNLQFQDLMYQTQQAPGAQLSDGNVTPAGVQFGMGSKPVVTSRSFSQGDMITTEGTLDIAIQGKGFFRVTMPDGSYAYTRDGAFKINPDGNLVTNDGYRVDGIDQIDKNATDITIDREGTVNIVVNNQVQKLSPILLSNFANADGLRNIGGNLYIETESSGAVETGITPGQNGTGTLQQGFLENSNVRVVEEMVNMIRAQRAYEINAKAIQTTDEMMSLANNLRR